MRNDDENAPEAHTLTYPGKVDPVPGSLLGPGMNGKQWKVLGSVYDPATNTTSVEVEHFHADEPTPLAALRAASVIGRKIAPRRTA